LEAARALLVDLQARLDTARNQVKALEDKDALSAETIRLLKDQVANLEHAVETQRAIVANLETEVKTLKDDNARVREERDSARHQRTLFTVLGVVGGVLLALLGTHGGN